jgi:hypothetical protein
MRSSLSCTVRESTQDFEVVWEVRHGPRRVIKPRLDLHAPQRRGVRRDVKLKRNKLSEDDGTLINSLCMTNRAPLGVCWGRAAAAARAPGTPSPVRSGSPQTWSLREY